MAPLRALLLSAAVLLAFASAASAASVDPGGPCRPSCPGVDLGCEPWCLTAQPSGSADTHCLSIGTDPVAVGTECAAQAESVETHCLSIGTNPVSIGTGCAVGDRLILQPLTVE